jgi:Tfp pilus assembly protein PilV
MNIIEILISMLLFGIALFSYIDLQHITIQTQNQTHHQYVQLVETRNALQ